MNSKIITLAVSIFALIVVGMFIYAQLKKSELKQIEIVPSGEEQLVSDPYEYISRVDAKHYFVDGVHTLAGEINMPTPCDLLEGQAAVAESYPEQVTIDFTVLNTTESCAQTVTPQRFKIDFSASEKAVIRARFMGRDTELNLIPAAPGEVPEDFEVFIKG